MKLAELMDTLMEIAGRPDVDPDELEVTIPRWDPTVPMTFSPDCAPVFVQGPHGDSLQFVTVESEVGDSPYTLLCLCLDPEQPPPRITH